MLQRANSRAVPGTRTGAAELAAGERLGVAVVDQMPLFREGLSVRVLRDPGMRLVGVTGQLNPAVLLRARLAVDVLVIDALLDPRALVARRLIEADAELTVVLLVREPYRTGQYLATMLAAGVHGLVQHSSPPERILEAIRRSRSAGRYVDPTLAPLISDGVSSVAGRPLSRREDEVLRLIADGLSNQGIADALVVSVETVRTHIKSLLRKLSARDRAHAVALGFRAGLLPLHGPRPVPPDEVGVGRVPMARGAADQAPAVL
ncbi:MAG TPA: response regulator transcription factor [Pseudonocardiaceae bacterium]|nr:response regulator transcription factor [Pseudonocardiaceae bacterium]